MHGCMYVCYIHTYIHTYIHAYMHTHIHKYTHTYIHTHKARQADRLYELNANKSTSVQDRDSRSSGSSLSFVDELNDARKGEAVVV